MTDQTKTDMVMFFKVTRNQEVPAECALEIDPNDPFMAGFRWAPYQDYSNFFQVLEFNLELALKPDDENVGTMSKNDRDHGKHGQNGGGDGQNSRVSGQFARWRSLSHQQVHSQKVKYPVEFDKFTFKRLIDSASPIFFQNCCNSVSFHEAVLVKRLSTGGNKPGFGFLRFEFKDVLIISVNWDDGDVVAENCTFICKHLLIKYRPQTYSGSPDKAPKPAQWDQTDASRAQGDG
jgi:type VI protein secretion system component Hcp